MIIDINNNSETVGAYIIYKDYFLFMFGRGANLNNKELGIVRFGGHIEKDETTKECVIREVKEETKLDCHLFDNQTTYMLDNHTNEYKKIHFNEEKPQPILIIKKDNNKLSVMYLAYAKGTLATNMETQGILLLRKDDIELICSKKLTFAEYKAMGRKYILSDKLAELDIEAENFTLAPKIQLLFLNQLFKLEPQLMKKFVNF